MVDMKSLFFRISLKRRIWISFVLITVICIAVTGLYSYDYASGVMERNAVQSSQNMLNKTAQVVDERLRHVVVAASTFMMGEAFQRAMRDVQENNASSYYDHLSALQTPFAQMKLNELSIDSVFIHTPIGDFYPTDKARRQGLAFGDTTIQEAVRLADEPWNTLWVGGHREEFFTRGDPVVSLVMKPLFDFYLQDVYIIVNLKEDTLMKLISENLENRQIEQLLYMRDGNPVLMSEAGASFMDDPQLRRRLAGANKGNFEYKQPHGTAYLVNYAELEMNKNWVLIGYQSKSDLLAPMLKIRWAILMIMGGCIVMAFIFASVLSEVLLRPLLKLRGLMLKAGRNRLDVRFESRYEDEVTQVGYKFNLMLEQIQSLIEEVKLSEQEKRKSEIKALQAQIDPHFLYNTLNTIYWKSELEEHDAVKEMIVSLALLFRLGLNNGKEITSVAQEIEHVSQYLKLQSECYADMFSYSIRVEDKRLCELPILKIILQPLVENSILHGFQDMNRKGRIEINVFESREDLVIEVSDNGCGMDVREVRKRMKGQGDGRESYALSNVQTRLQLYYGEKARMEMESVPNERTKVTLFIPMGREGS
ncbi:sensor histidine kinase [Paenibacillus tarimensis]